MEKFGLFGGTFDPPHIEHINLLERVKNEFSLDCVVVLPNGNPPHKQSMASCNDRLQMAKLCFEQVDDYELGKHDICYTYQTLMHFQKAERELYFIMGGDSLSDMPTWRHPEKILSLCKIICVGREQQQQKEVEGVLYSSYIGGEISSSKERILIEYGVNSNNLSCEVKEYIKKHKLYNCFSPYVKVAKKNLDSKRFLHTIQTTIMADKLNQRHKLKVPFDKLFIATCMHDIGKDLSYDEICSLQLSEEILCSQKKVLHQYTGAALTKKLFPQLEDDVLSAIETHTTFAQNMTPLQLLVAVADSVESSRNYDGVTEIRELAFRDLRKAAKACIENIIEKEKHICPQTLSAWEFYKEI